MRLAVLALLASACTPSVLFPCTASEPCGPGGTCAAPGFCAFADTECPSGQRFGELAPAELAGTCVDVPDAGPSEMTFVASADAWIDSEFPTRNHGGQTVVRTDHDPPRYGLLRFDLGALPAGATVVSVELRVWTAASMGGFNMGGVIRLYALREAWDEGTADDAVGVVSWNQRQTGTNWSTAGAGGAARAAEASGEIPATADDTEYVVTIPAALVQGWVDDAGTNFGWLLIAENAMTDSAHLVSSEGAEAKRPRLVVSYR